MNKKTLVMSIGINTVGIVGCRKFKDYDIFKEKIQEWIIENGQINKIISGGASGVDSLAEQYATEFDIELVIHKPDWDKYGNAAGPKRNTLIVNDSDKLIAFPSKSSKGTWDSVRKAKKVNKEVTIYNI